MDGMYKRSRSVHYAGVICHTFPFSFYFTPGFTEKGGHTHLTRLSFGAIR